jgi:hypothetical protein
MEVAINTPFESNEIKDIACAEFELDYNVKIKLSRTGETTIPTETLAWGNVAKGAPGAVVEEAEIANSKFVSKDPNTERLSRDMPLTVETTDGKGGKTRKKVRVKG